MKLYIDKQLPFACVESERLTDGSEVWNLYFRGTPDGHRDADVIHCTSQQAANDAFALIAAALKTATGENPLVL